jgi:hypothetical protein
MKTNLHGPRLAILQQADSFRRWRSVSDRRVCIFCDRVITGSQIVIRRNRAGAYELFCPTAGCRGTPREWVYPGNPLISETAYQDWWRALGEENAQSSNNGVSAAA